MWDREGNKGEELNGKTVAIIGYVTSNGRAFAEKLKGFNVNVIAYGQYKRGFLDGHVERSFS